MQYFVLFTGYIYISFPIFFLYIVKIVPSLSCCLFILICIYYIINKYGPLFVFNYERAQMTLFYDNNFFVLFKVCLSGLFVPMHRRKFVCTLALSNIT